MGVDFEEVGNQSARRKPSKSGWDRRKLCPQTTFVVEVEGVVDVRYASLTSQLTNQSGQWTSLACMFCFPISDHVMPSWEFAFCFFISYAYICTCIRWHLKETIPSSSITWSEMGKQNIQTKAVNYLTICNSAYYRQAIDVSHVRPELLYPESSVNFHGPESHSYLQKPFLSRPFRSQAGKAW